MRIQGWSRPCFCTLQAAISLACIAYASLQSYCCLLRYLSWPTGTSLRYKDIATMPRQPAFTFCKAYKVEECRVASDLGSDYLYVGCFESRKEREDGECYWDDGTIASYHPDAADVEKGNLTKNRNNTDHHNWRQRHSANTHNMMVRILGWNESASSWSKLWPLVEHQEVADAVTVRQVGMPLSEEETAVCSTFNFKNLNNYRVLNFLAFQTAPPVLMYIHMPGQLFEPSRTSGQFFFYKRLVQRSYKLRLVYNKELPMGEDSCTLESGSFDDCVHDYAEKAMMNKANCSALFFDQKETVCRNFSDGQRAFQAYVEAFWSQNMRTRICRLPCHFYDVDIKFQTYHQLLEGFLTAPMEERMTDASVNIQIPSMVQVAETSYSYDLSSLIAEVGGWLGLFIGILVYAIISVVVCLSKALIRLYGVSVWMAVPTIMYYSSEHQHFIRVERGQ